MTQSDRRTANTGSRTAACARVGSHGCVSAQAYDYGRTPIRRPHALEPAPVSRPGAHQMCSERAASARRPYGAWQVCGLGSPEPAPEWAKPPPHHGLWCAQHLNNSGDLGEGATPAGVRCTSPKKAQYPRNGGDRYQPCSADRRLPLRALTALPGGVPAPGRVGAPGARAGVTSPARLPEKNGGRAGVRVLR